jgi:hypothetical protein
VRERGVTNVLEINFLILITKRKKKTCIQILTNYSYFTTDQQNIWITVFLNFFFFNGLF